jgi:hypothetical protein
MKHLHNDARFSAGGDRFRGYVGGFMNRVAE